MTIAQVSKMYGLSADTLRYYERIGLIAPVGRTAGGIRMYTEDDCKWINFAKCMRASGIQVEALTRYVLLFHQGDNTREERKQILIGQRDKIVLQMQEMQKTIDRLNSKIERYEKVIVPIENELK